MLRAGCIASENSVIVVIDEITTSIAEPFYLGGSGRTDIRSISTTSEKPSEAITGPVYSVVIPDSRGSFVYEVNNFRISV